MIPILTLVVLSFLNYKLLPRPACVPANLFQRFRRLSATPTGGESSTGLGLALVRDLVTQHHGRIWAEPAPGSGSIFIAEFPCG
jgi:signal transduction histidine kinase